MRDERRSPRISIGDGLLLIAATGIGLGAVRYVVINMLRGQTSLLDIFSSPRGGWTTFDVLRRAQDLLVALLPFVGGWTIVLPVLRLRQQRFSREHLFLQPGMTACVSAMLGIALGAIVLSGSILTALTVDGKLSAPLTAWLQRFLIEQLLTYAGIAVSVAWIMQAISGRWKPWPDWIDRLGRFLGVIWITAGLLWATRPYLVLL